MFSTVLSEVLVVINTERAAESQHVSAEVGAFLAWSGGPIIPIEVSCAVENALWWKHAAGISRIKEAEGLATTGTDSIAPSARVVQRVVNSVGFRRLSRRQSVGGSDVRRDARGI
jgi:hypothetical protein